jgi:hypothetical protein
VKILMVLTSHDQLGNTGRKTGFWLKEFAAPYFVFRDAGVDVTLASPKGGQPPIDPKSDLPENQTPAMTRFKKDAVAQKALANTVRLARLSQFEASRNRPDGDPRSPRGGWLRRRGKGGLSIRHKEDMYGTPCGR